MNIRDGLFDLNLFTETRSFFLFFGPRVALYVHQRKTIHRNAYRATYRLFFKDPPLFGTLVSSGGMEGLVQKRI